MASAMEQAWAECKRRMRVQCEILEEEQGRMLAQLMRAHTDEVARLKVENEDLRARLELAEQCSALRGTTCVGQQIDEVKLGICDVRENLINFPGWSTVLASDVVRVQAIAEDGAMTVGVHLAVLQRSPYFEARLASRWSETASATDSALPLRLPAGCPVAAALLLFQLLYSETGGSCGVTALPIQDAGMAISVAQLAGMLLLDDLRSDLAHLACGLLASTAEAVELQRRFVTLPSAVSAVCRGAFDVPAVAMVAPELARMLQGTARSPAARPRAEAVLAAHGRTAACVEAVIVALEAMPFKVGTSQHGCHQVVQIDGEAFDWLWGLVQEYLLVPGSGASLLRFFRSVAGLQEVHSITACQASTALFDDSVSSVRAAFGKYLSHLASARSEELCEAFRLGVAPELRPSVTHRSQTCRIDYPNVLHFGHWSRTLLPRLLRAAGPAQSRLQAELMELPPKVLAGLIDDTLLDAFGGDMALVCDRISQDASVLMQWVTRRRLLAVPLVARRNLCIRLVPSLGALPRDIAAVVVQVMAGSAAQELAYVPYKVTGRRTILAMASMWTVVLSVVVLHFLGLRLVETSP